MGPPIWRARALSRSKVDGFVPRTLRVNLKIYPTESVYEVVLQMSIPAQTRQLILYHYQYKCSRAAAADPLDTGVPRS